VVTKEGKEDSSNLEIISGNKLKVFLKYVLLNTISIMAITSSGIVDAYFIGQYVNSESLAAVNIVIPVFSLVFGITIMFTIGSAVRVGKYIGENQIEKANSTFTTSVAVVAIIIAIISMLMFIFSERVAMLLGSNDELLSRVVIYLSTISPFLISLTLNFVLSAYIRVDGKPLFALFAVIISLFLNILLNYIFIIHLNMGLYGAAFATGLSTIPSTMVLFIYFFTKYSNISFVSIRKFESFKKILISAYNGLSEFISEASIGFVIFIYNGAMINFASSAGVAAFTAINYLLWASGMMSYAIGDTVMPLISINFGARRYDRVRSFLKYSIIGSVSVVITIFLIATIYNEQLISIFIKDIDSRAYSISVEFLSYVKWGFLFASIPIILSAYFTAMHRPMESFIIAILRGAVFPLSTVLILPIFFNEYGIYTSFLVSNILAFICAIFLFYINQKYGRIKI